MSKSTGKLSHSNTSLQYCSFVLHSLVAHSFAMRFYFQQAARTVSTRWKFLQFRQMCSNTDIHLGCHLWLQPAIVRYDWRCWCHSERTNGNNYQSSLFETAVHVSRNTSDLHACRASFSVSRTAGHHLGVVLRHLLENVSSQQQGHGASFLLRFLFACMRSARVTRSRKSHVPTGKHRRWQPMHW